MNNLKKNKTFLGIFVTVMIAGLIGAYAPLLFQKPQIIDESDRYVPPQTASFTPTKPVSTTTPPIPQKPAPNGFSGLNEENQSIKDLEKLIND